MANMFSGNLKKRIPKNLKECYQTDNVTNNLWVWCERLEKWGFRVCLALAILGITTIIRNGIEINKLLNEFSSQIKLHGFDEFASQFFRDYGIKIKSVSEVVIDDIITWFLYCFIEYCSYHALALLIGALATITQHTRITANITLYNTAKAEGITDEDCNDESEDKEENTKAEKPKRKCNKITHEKYISETPDINTDGKNTKWIVAQTTGNKKLICVHCGKELMSIVNQQTEQSTPLYSEEDIQDIQCPHCKNTLSIYPNEKNLICPYCEKEVHI